MQVGVNKVILIGRVNEDAVATTTSEGKKVASFILATAEKWEDPQTREKKKRVVKHRVTCWNKVAEIAEQYIKGGTVAFVEGWLSYERFTDTIGYTRHSAQLVANYVQALSQELAEEKSGPTYYPNMNAINTGWKGLVGQA